MVTTNQFIPVLSGINKECLRVAQSVVAGYGMLCLSDMQLRTVFSESVLGGGGMCMLMTIDVDRIAQNRQIHYETVSSPTCPNIAFAERSSYCMANP